MIENEKKKLIQTLETANSFVIVGHTQPDGDSLGTQLGLFHVLKNMGKDVTILVRPGEVPPQYRFLPGVNEFTDLTEEATSVDCLISVDVPNLERISEARAWFDKARVRVNIDHHLDNAAFADINIVDIKQSSSSEIVFWILTENGIEIPYEAAVCLYVGIVTDTGRFQYSNTSARTLEAARILVEKGVKPQEIFSAVYENMSYEAIRLLGKVLERSHFRSGFVWSVIEQADMASTGAKLSETEIFIDLLRSVGGARAAGIFKQVGSDGKPEWRVSLRAKAGYDVQSIAARHGGGGHRQAAGFRTDLDVDEVVEEIIEDLNQQEKLKD
jgi:phosphoesterase RecJ-like protein